jgi:hypothetical protein
MTGGGEDTTKALEELLGKATKMVAMSEAYLRQVHTTTPPPLPHIFLSQSGHDPSRPTKPTTVCYCCRGCLGSLGSTLGVCC